MADGDSANRRVPPRAMRDFIARAFEAVDMPAQDAADCARLMVEADLTGFDAHGIFRLKQYIGRIKGAGFNVRPDIKIIRETDSTALVHGDNGMGHLVMQRAAEIAMDKAEKHGIGWVGSCYSNHAGAASTYATMPLERDMIGLYCAVGSANHSPPWGGIEMLLSTNPIAVAVPAKEEPPIVMDFATTVSSSGKVKTYAQRGEPMPEGWMIDREGNPLTDASQAHDGFLLPIGGHKGYALGLIIGLLAGTLNSAAMGRDVVDFNADPNSETNTGQFIAAISVAGFGGVDAFKERVDKVARDLRGSATLPGVDKIHVPGDGRAFRRKDYAENGVPLHPNLLKTLDSVADELGIATLI